jgi:hypothetical protein
MIKSWRLSWKGYVFTGEIDIKFRTKNLNGREFERPRRRWKHDTKMYVNKEEGHVKFGIVWVSSSRL